MKYRHLLHTSPAHCTFSMTRSVRYQPILHTLYYTLHTEHAYCLSYRYLNNVVITTVIEMVEMVEILEGRLGQRSVERVRYVINNLLHLVIVKYGDISLVLCISTRLRLVTILSLLVKYLVIYTLTRVISLIYCTLSREYFPRPSTSENIPTLGSIYTNIPLGRVEYLVYITQLYPQNTVLGRSLSDTTRSTQKISKLALWEVFCTFY